MKLSREEVLHIARLARLGPVGVPELVQPVDQLPRRHRLTPADLERPGEHPWIDTLHLTMDAGVDHLGEHDVVVPQHAEKHHERPR